MRKRIPLEHPGVILKEEFLDPYNVTPSRVAELIGVDRRRMCDIVNGKREISADTALRLGLLFRTTPEFWLNLQCDYDLRKEKIKKLDMLQKNIEPLDSVS